MSSTRLLGGNNYISTKTFANQSGTEYVTDVEYYDGLGYLVQKQSSHASPSGGVLVQPVVYDNMRRADATAYLPYSSIQQDMMFRQNAVSEQGTWYASRFGGSRYAFSNTVYESGPQGRPVSTMKPGEVYRSGNHSATVDYSLNEEADSVRRIGFDPLGFCVLPDGYYPEHSVRRVTSTDEDGRASTVFSDAFGRTLLTRQYEGFGGSGRRCDTYYVYDVRDSLVCVIQPEGVPHIEESMALSSDEVSLDVEFLDRYCFTWKYDAWGNVLESHVPGGGTSYFVYDDRDRCTFFADSDMMEHSLCIHRVYDDLDRLTAEYYGSGFSEEEFYDFALLRSMGYYDASGSHIPTGRGLEFQEDSIARLGMVRNDRCLMMPSYEFILECPDHNQQEDAGQDGGWVERAFYYDHKGRLIQTVEAGSDGWCSRYSMLYDFVGNVLAAVETHTPPGGTADVLYTEYTYDQRGRMLTSLVTLNWDRQHEVAYSYDELGRPNGKEFRTFEGEDDTPVTLASESLTRNLQGWRTGTSVAYDGMPVFGELLCHYDPMMGVPQYSGMISEISYGHGDMMDMQSYSYDYDGLGRFTYSDHYLNGSLSEENFETGFRYDRNGNILSFERYGNRMNYYTGTNLEDNPEFHYDGNRLVRARRLPFIDEDGNIEENPDCLYSYDSNGKLVSDGRQGLDISYNVLNFPKEITNDEGMTATYTYLSDGSKRSVSTHDGLGKLYRGSFVYDGGSASLESIATPEGRLVSTTDGILDLWYAKDYLGNVRSVIDLASGVIEENDYLPFGTRIQDDNQPVMSDNRWRYANKEEQSSLVGGSCNLIDFGARNYDPWSARWTTTDPMAILYNTFTPYSYCLNNPTRYVDPLGLWTTDSNGMLIQEEGDDENSLAEFLHIDIEDARVIFASQCYKMLSDDIYPAYCIPKKSNSSVLSRVLAWSGFGVSSLQSVASPFENTTFYLGGAQNKKRFYHWESGWNKGNQYIPRNQIHLLGNSLKWLRRASYVINLMSIYQDYKKLQFLDNKQNDEAIMLMFDMGVNALGLIPDLSLYASFLSVCGKSAVKRYVELNVWNMENGLPPVHMIED